MDDTPWSDIRCPSYTHTHTNAPWFARAPTNGIAGKGICVPPVIPDCNSCAQPLLTRPPHSSDCPSGCQLPERPSRKGKGNTRTEGSPSAPERKAPTWTVGWSRKGFLEVATDLHLEGQGSQVTKGEEWPRTGHGARRERQMRKASPAAPSLPFSSLTH